MRYRDSFKLKRWTVILRICSVPSLSDDLCPAAKAGIQNYNFTGLLNNAAGILWIKISCLDHDPCLVYPYFDSSAKNT
jgi:hypothetical protein